MLCVRSVAAFGQGLEKGSSKSTSPRCLMVGQSSIATGQGAISSPVRWISLGKQAKLNPMLNMLMATTQKSTRSIHCNLEAMQVHDFRDFLVNLLHLRIALQVQPPSTTDGFHGHAFSAWARFQVQYHQLIEGTQGGQTL